MASEPLGMATCDICAKRFDAYNLGLIISRCCGSIHCPECAQEAEKRGDYSPDGDCVGDPPAMVDASYWRCCKACLPCCPNCGKPANFIPTRNLFLERSKDCVETHGLECGPYERWTETWLVCDRCRAKTDDKEVRAANPEFFAEDVHAN